MREFFCLGIFLATIFVSGCFGGTFSVESTGTEIKFKGNGAGGTTAYIELADGDFLFGEAEVDGGQLEMKIGNKVYTFDKTQEISIELPAGSYDVFFEAREDFKGEMTLHILPKI